MQYSPGLSICTPTKAVSLAHHPATNMLEPRESVVRSRTTFELVPHDELLALVEFSPPHIATLETIAPCTPKKQELFVPVQVEKLKLSTGTIMVPLRPLVPDP